MSKLLLFIIIVFAPVRILAAVSDGQAINAAITNAAFMDKNTTNTFTISIADIQGGIETKVANDSVSTGASQNVTLLAPVTVYSNVSLTSIQNITFTNRADGSLIWLRNNTGGTLSLINQSGGTASLQIDTGTGGNLAIPNSSTVSLYYDTVESKWHVSGIPGLTNPMSTGGDIIYGGAGGTSTRLANGSAGQFLQSAGGTSAPAWALATAPTRQVFSQTGYYTFTIASSTTLAGEVYSNNSSQFTTVYACAACTTLVTYRSSGTNAPSASGTLTYVSGTDSGNISYSAFVATGQYQLPTGTKWIHVILVGDGGGGGGTASGAANSGGGGGGGGGATSIAWIASPSSTYTFSIGAGGAGGAAGNNSGTSGAGSTFSYNTMSAGGGTGGGGSGNTASIGYQTGTFAGGTASGGDINIPGSSGGPGLVLAATQASGGHGGTSLFGMGAPITVGTGAGAAGSLYGSGGGGGCEENNGGTKAGGAGAQGILIIEEFTQ
jgi:hypothetical protein